MGYRDKKGISEKEQWVLYDEAISYFRNEVAPLYLDLIAENPIEGLYQALTDFLTNDSYFDDEEGQPIPWDDILRGLTIRN